MSEQQLKAKLMDAPAMQRALSRMAHEILEQLDPPENIVLVGIKRRGVPLARRLAALIERFEGVQVPVGELDITLYRDDLTTLYDQPKLKGASLPVDINGKLVVLVDDVIYTGRTVRAARLASVWRSWWIAATGSSPSARTSSARTSPPPTASALPSASPKSTAKTATPSTDKG